MPVRYKRPSLTGDLILNPKSGLARNNGYESLYEIMAKDFLQRAGELAFRLRQEVANADLEESKHVAQMLKNLARLAGAEKVSSLCAEILKLCSVGDLTETIRLSAILEDACEEAILAGQRKQYP